MTGSNKWSTLIVIVCACVGTAFATPVYGRPTHPAIVIMTMGDFSSPDAGNQDWADAVRARVAGINERGGLRDATSAQHPLELTVCDTAADLVRTLDCAYQAINAHVVAVVGFASTFGANALALLEDAHIPVVGNYLATGTNTSPVAFPLGPGLLTQMRAMPTLLAQTGVTRLAVLISDYGPATDDLVRAIEGGTPRTAQLSTIRIPSNRDLTQAALTALGAHPDGIIGFVSGGTSGTLIDTLRGLGYTGLYVTRTRFGNAAMASDPAHDDPGLLLVGQFMPYGTPTPWYRELHHDLPTYTRDHQPDEGVINYWTAVRFFEQLSSQERTITATSILRALSVPVRRSTGGATAGLEPAAVTELGADGVVRTSVRAINPYVVVEHLHGDTVVPTTKGFFDPLTSTYTEPAPATKCPDHRRC